MIEKATDSVNTEICGVPESAGIPQFLELLCFSTYSFMTFVSRESLRLYGGIHGGQPSARLPVHPWSKSELEDRDRMAKPTAPLRLRRRVPAEKIIRRANYPAGVL